MCLVLPSVRRFAQVSPDLYVPPKQRWWPTLAALAGTGVCLLAIFGPSQPAGQGGQAVYRVSTSYAILAKHLAPAPPSLTLNRDRVHAGSIAESEPAPSNATGAQSAITRIDLSKPAIFFEARIEASPARPTATKRYLRQSILRASYASARQHLRRLATRSHRGEKRRNILAGYYHNYEMSPYRRYQMAGTRYGY